MFAYQSGAAGWLQGKIPIQRDNLCKVPHRVNKFIYHLQKKCGYLQNSSARIFTDTCAHACDLEWIFRFYSNLQEFMNGYQNLARISLSLCMAFGVFMPLQSILILSSLPLPVTIALQILSKYSQNLADFSTLFLSQANFAWLINMGLISAKNSRNWLMSLAPGFCLSTCSTNQNVTSKSSSVLWFVSQEQTEKQGSMSMGHRLERRYFLYWVKMILQIEVESRRYFGVSLVLGSEDREEEVRVVSQGVVAVSSYGKNQTQGQGQGKVCQVGSGLRSKGQNLASCRSYSAQTVCRWLQRPRNSSMDRQLLDSRCQGKSSGSAKFITRSSSWWECGSIMRSSERHIF